MDIFPVIHFHSLTQAERNAAIAVRSGAPGFFLISTEGDDRGALAAARVLQVRYPDRLVGFNGLNLSPLESVRASLDAGLGMTWSDTPGVTSDRIDQEAHVISDLIARTGHRFLASVAFKYQSYELDPAAAAARAHGLGFHPTTSGPATGEAVSITKLETIRRGYPLGPLALASGVTSANVAAFIPFIDAALVATGIGSNFYEIDPMKLCDLIRAAAG